MKRSKQQINKTKKAVNAEPWLKSEPSQKQTCLRLGVGLSYLAGCVIIAQAALLAWIVYSALFLQHSRDQLIPYFMGLGAVIIVRCILIYASNNALGKAAAQIKYHMRTRLYNDLQNKSYHFAKDKGSGALVNALSDGIEAAGKYYKDYLPVKSLMMALPLSIVVVAFPMDWWSALIMLLTAPLIPVFMILIGKGAETMNQRQWQKMARLSNHFLDAIQGMTTLKLFSATQREITALDRSSEIYRRDTMAVLRLAFLSALVLEFFATVSIAVIAVLIGFRLLWGDMNFYNGFFVLLLAPEFYLPLRKMGVAYHARMEAIGAADLLQEISHADNEGNSPSNALQMITLKSAPSIMLDEVSFSYGDDKKRAIDDVSIAISPAQKIAIIGESGAGKSTILSLLLGGNKPRTGTVKINDIDLCDMDINHWRSNVSWMPQMPTLFQGSVMDNIRLGRQNASDTDIKSICEKLGVDDFIQSLPDGYETQLGERGFGLSGGQVRRIALARAFLRDAPLLIMDEPTASLDRETESIIQSAIRGMAKDKTVITIAHRLHTISDADQIVLMDHGHVIDCGSYDGWLKNSAQYQAFLAGKEVHKS